MKRLIATIICLIALTVAAVPVGAQTRYRNRSVWDSHRDKITTVGGAVGGAILGGLIGGKKGAAIGAITGGAGAAVYTYKIRNKSRRY
jgi:outer membrane lipoprotein SlyB